MLVCQSDSLFIATRNKSADLASDSDCGLCYLGETDEIAFEKAVSSENTDVNSLVLKLWLNEPYYDAIRKTIFTQKTAVIYCPFFPLKYPITSCSSLISLDPQMSAVKYGEPGEVPSLLVVSNQRFYFLEMTSDMQ